MNGSRGGDRARSHHLLALAAVSPAHEALAAWRNWSAEFSLDTLDGEGYWILPLLFSNLSGAGSGGLPGDFPERQRLAGVYKQMRLRNAIAEPLLRQALDSMAQEGCDVLPGAVTALALAGGETAIALDPCELLAPVQSLAAATAILQSRGWQTLMPLPPDPLRPFVESVRLRHPQAGDVVLRWRPFGLDAPVEQDTGLWHRAVTVRAGGRAIRQPEPSDLLRMVQGRGTWLQQCVLKDRLRMPFDATSASPAALTDAAVSLPRLAARHWLRYRSCTPDLRPRGFLRYLIDYYRYAWQARSPAQLVRATFKQVGARKARMS